MNYFIHSLIASTNVLGKRFLVTTNAVGIVVIEAFAIVVADALGLHCFANARSRGPIAYYQRIF